MYSACTHYWYSPVHAYTTVYCPVHAYTTVYCPVHAYTTVYRPVLIHNCHVYGSIKHTTVFSVVNILTTVYYLVHVKCTLLSDKSQNLRQGFVTKTSFISQVFLSGLGIFVDINIYVMKYYFIWFLHIIHFF